MHKRPFTRHRLDTTDNDREARLQGLVEGYARAESVFVPQYLLDERERGARTESSPPVAPEPPSAAPADPAPAAEPSAASAEAPVCDRDPGPRLHVFDPLAVQRALKSVQDLGRHHERRVMVERSLTPFAENLFADVTTGLVPLAEVAPHLEQDLQRLREMMPNFAVVIDSIAPALQLQRCGDCALRMPPMLLAGPPGVGKSYFAEQLARTLCLHYVAVNLETTTAIWILTGASQGWSGGGPGIVFKTLAAAPHANPLILLDEADKTIDGKYPVINALYRLLEPHSAAQFSDEAFPEIKLDASAINWVLTANDSERIPAPLRSRLQCFDVPEPNAAQRRKIAATVYSDLIGRESWGPSFAPTLDESTERTLAAVDGSVRDLHRVIIRACAVANAASRSQLTRGDVIAAIRSTTPPMDLATAEPGGNA